MKNPAGLSRSLSLSVVAHAVVLLFAIVVATKLVPLEIPTVMPDSLIFTLEDASAQPSVAPRTAAAEILFTPPPIVRPLLSPPVNVPAAETRVIEKSATVQPDTAKAPRMTIDDFRKQHPAPTRSTAAPPRVTTPHVKVYAFGESAVPAVPRPNASSAQTNPFIAALIQNLRDAYVSIGEEDAALSCRIEFVLRADGRVESSRILVSSGNRLFDDAVRDALKRVRTQQPPASFTGNAITTTFRTRGDR